jgi:uncharacterized protein YbaP (TraB family)
MKKVIFLSLILSYLISGFARGQNLETDSLRLNKKEIYILGTFHFREHDFKKYPQDINKEIRKAISFKPDIVCVEWMDKSEELDLYNIDYSKNISELIDKMKLDTAKAPLIIDSIYKELSKNPDCMENRAKLANYFYITRDYINACYQWYLIEKAVKDSVKLKTLLPEDIKTYRQSLYKDPRNQKNEIVEIAFPIAKAMAHEKIYSIDYRHDQNEYGKYANLFTERFQTKYGYDPMEKKTENLLKKTLGWLESDRLNNTSTYYKKLNSVEFEKQLFAYYYDMFISYSYDSDYRKWHELQLEQRNWKVFELLIKSINESNAKRTFVLVGTTHKIFLDRYLNESNKFKIIDYNELK